METHKPNSSEANKASMLAHFGPDEYGVKHYDKNDKEIVDEPRTLSEKNTEEMGKYFGPDEYGVKNYDKDGKEVDGYDNLKKTKYEKDFAEAKKMDKEHDEAHVSEKQAKELEQLEKEIAQARSKFAKVDYDETKLSSRLRRILGKKIGDIRSDTRVNVHNAYKIKLTELLDRKAEGLKDGNLSPEELDAKLEELHKYFDTDEKANLYAARTDARSEAWKGKIGGEIIGKAGSFINWYREMGKTKKGMVGKAAISMGLTAVGLGAVAVGMRAVGGAAAGVGVTAALEARYRSKEKQKTESEREKFLTENKLKNLEDRLFANRLKLDKMIDGYSEDLTKERKEGFKRRCAGAAVGVFIGSGAMGDLLKGGAHMIGDTDIFKSVSGYVANSEITKTTVSFWKDKLEGLFNAGKIAAADMKEGASHLFGTQEAMAAEKSDKEFPFSNHGIMDVHETPIKENLPVLDTQYMREHGIGVPASEAPAGEIHTDLPNGASGAVPVENSGVPHPEVGKIDLDVEKDESVQGEIIERLKSMGMDAHEAGTKASLMYEKFIEGTGRSYDKVYPGTQIELGPDGEGGLKILNIAEADKLGNIHHDVATEKPEAMPKEAPVAYVGKPDVVKETPSVEPEKPEAMPKETPVTSTEKPETPAASAEPENHSAEDQAAQAKAAAADIEKAEQFEETTQKQLEEIQRVKASLDGNHSPQAEAMRAQIAQMEKLAQEEIAESHHLASTLEREMEANHESYNGYGYENFSNYIDTSVNALTTAKLEILSTYSGEIQGDGDIDKVLKALGDKGTLSASEQQQLTMLKNYKESFGTTYGKILKSFFGLKDGVSDATLDLNANQYLAEHKQSRAAKIFEGLMKTMTPGEMVDNSPNPQPNEKMIDWSKRIINIFILKKAESIQ